MNLPEVQRSSVRHHMHFRTKKKEKRKTLSKKQYNKNQEQQYKNTISFKDLKILSKQDPEKKLLLSMAMLVAWLLDLNAHQEYLRMI